MTSQLTLLPADLLGEAAADGPSLGEVFTRSWVVEFILDLVGYRFEGDLASKVVVEPACGTGAFLIPIVDRLVRSCQRHGRTVADASGAIQAFDVASENVDLARTAVVNRLTGVGVSSDIATSLAQGWIMTADFLLKDHVPLSADFVVGNPPYVRLEEVPRQRTEAYRRAWRTMRGRSDLYVGFLEAGLRLLAPDGLLGFICADRWMYNQYGSALRQLVSDRYSVETVVSMHDVDAFEDEVSAYPAVVVLKNASQGSVTLIEATKEFGSVQTPAVRDWIGGQETALSRSGFRATRLPGWFKGSNSWPGGAAPRQALVADLERRFPPVEDPATGTRVGIGVATGCDDVFITTDPDLVENGRLLPLLLGRDTSGGFAAWSGHYLVNPWNSEGLVDLNRYPRLNAYLELHGKRLKGRYVAKQRPRTWYRTIDKVDSSLRTRAKLLIPDIKALADPVLDAGSYYPHHNLYFVVSEAWDLEVLGGLLMSGVANAIIGSYSVKMRGGYYRFQAQYLRRIRLPELNEVGSIARVGLAEAFRSRDRQGATDIAAQLYGIDRSFLREALETDARS